MNINLSKHKNGSAPENSRLYAVGDVHGEAQLVRQIVDLIDRDNRQREELPATLLFLGDYVDRGPASKDVVDFLMQGLPPAFSPIFLKGNHEDLLLSFLSDPSYSLNWLHNGGDETLRSYGLASDIVQRAFWGGRLGVYEAATLFQSSLPKEHLNFYSSLKTSYRWGTYFFAHAGVRPGIALDRQSEEDLLWIRDEFLTWPGDFGAIVVHGHTPARLPEDHHNRIGIDTYAFQTGKLTAVGLEGSSRWFIST